jgi:hypothetical protein
MTGMITGGWEYILAAYTISGAVLVAYGLSLILRLRLAAHRAEGSAPPRAGGGR